MQSVFPRCHPSAAPHSSHLRGFELSSHLVLNTVPGHQSGRCEAGALKTDLLLEQLWRLRTGERATF